MRCGALVPVAQGTQIDGRYWWIADEIKTSATEAKEAGPYQIDLNMLEYLSPGDENFLPTGLQKSHTLLVFIESFSGLTLKGLIRYFSFCTLSWYKDREAIIHIHVFMVSDRLGSMHKQFMIEPRVNKDISLRLPLVLDGSYGDRKLIVRYWLLHEPDSASTILARTFAFFVKRNFNNMFDAPAYIIKTIINRNLLITLPICIKLQILHP